MDGGRQVFFFLRAMCFWLWTQNAENGLSKGGKMTPWISLTLGDIGCTQFRYLPNYYYMWCTQCLQGLTSYVEARHGHHPVASVTRRARDLTGSAIFSPTRKKSKNLKLEIQKIVMN